MVKIGKAGGLTPAKLEEDLHQQGRKPTCPPLGLFDSPLGKIIVQFVLEQAHSHTLLLSLEHSSVVCMRPGQGTRTWTHIFGVLTYIMSTTLGKCLSNERANHGAWGSRGVGGSLVSGTG